MLFVVSICYFSHYVTKILDGSNLREEYFGSQCEGAVHHGGEDTAAGAQAAGYIVSTVRKQGGKCCTFIARPYHVKQQEWP